MSKLSKMNTTKISIARVHRNQAWRSTEIIGRKGNEVLVAYEMPSGVIYLNRVDTSRIYNTLIISPFRMEIKEFAYRTMSIRNPLKKWKEELDKFLNDNLEWFRIALETFHFSEMEWSSLKQCARANKKTLKRCPRVAVRSRIETWKFNGKSNKEVVWLCNLH